MAISSDEREYWFHKGELDAANGEYNSPLVSGASFHALTFGFMITDADIEREKAYDEGHKYGRRQSG